MPRRKVVKQVPVGKKIKKARTSKKIKLDQLANETGFSIDYLKDIESGKAIPSAPCPTAGRPSPSQFQFFAPMIKRRFESLFSSANHH